jgi:hypothetical protein
MCFACYVEAGRPWNDTGDAEVAAFLIRDLYSFASAGGAMHVVTDDANVEDSHVAWCIDHAYKYRGSDSPEDHAIEIAVGILMLDLDEDERWTALALQWGWN